jgi:hypothetical protein
MRKKEASYNQYRTFPSNTRSFNFDFLTAIEKGQIIVTFFTDEIPGKWTVWLMPYAEADWKEGNTKEDWKAWNKEVLKIDGGWDSFLVLRDYPSTDFQKQVSYYIKKHNALDIRLKPRRANPFALVIPDREETADIIKKLLNYNVGAEHTNVSFWREIEKNTIKESLCRKISSDEHGCVLYINQLPYSFIVLRKYNKADLVGGHTTLTEFIETWNSMFTVENIEQMTADDWERVHDISEKKGFLRELSEELGLIRNEEIDYIDEAGLTITGDPDINSLKEVKWMGYHGRKSGPEKPVWIYIDRSDVMIPIQIRIALAVDVNYSVV